jgi:glycosyltransferase involved in cell wall biosynthesis
MNQKVMAPDFTDHVRTVAPWVEHLVGAPNTMKRLHRALACDVILTPSRPLIRLLREVGVRRVEEFHHAFDPAVLDRVGAIERQPRAIFSGSLPHSFGAARFEVIERALDERTIDAYVPMVGGEVVPLPEGSAIAGLLGTFPPRALAGAFRRTGRGADAFDRATLRRLGMAASDRTADQSARLDLAARFPDRVHRPVHGLEMFRLLAAARLVVHHEVGTSPASLRLYEATGVGAALVTNRVEDLSSRFEPGAEILVYDHPKEAVELVRTLLADEALAARVGSAGQQRTLRDHTVEVRAAELDRILAGL